MPKTILFFASSPTNQASLRLDHEFRKVQAELRRSHLHDEFRLINQPATRFQDFLQVLRDDKPWLVHFSGHGDGAAGLMLENEAGQVARLPNDIFKEMLVLLGGQTHCIVLNACHSEHQAQQIAQYIPYVIGMNASVPDVVAIQFAQQFYAGLGAGETIENAFYLAVLAVRYHDRLGANLPVLYKQGRLLSQNPVLRPPSAKQQNFVEYLFNRYIKARRPVLVLAQQGFQIHHYIRALEHQALKDYGSEQMLHVLLPNRLEMSAEDYFADLAQQCGLQANVRNSTEWQRGMQERLRQGKPLFLLITGFESSTEAYRSELSSSLRNLLFSEALHLVMFGGERLAAMKYKNGKDSLLNIAEADPLPALCVEDIRTLYLGAGEENDISPETLQRVLDFAGQHPVLVRACLDAIQGGEVDWQQAVQQSHIPPQLFDQVRQHEPLCAYLDKATLGINQLWSANPVIRDLYWQNLLKPENGRLVWRCEWLRQFGKELLEC